MLVLVLVLVLVLGLEFSPSSASFESCRDVRVVVSFSVRVNDLSTSLQILLPGPELALVRVRVSVSLKFVCQRACRSCCVWSKKSRSAVLSSSTAVFDRLKCRLNVALLAILEMRHFLPCLCER